MAAVLEEEFRCMFVTFIAAKVMISISGVPSINASNSKARFFAIIIEIEFGELGLGRIACQQGWVDRFQWLPPGCIPVKEAKI